MTTTRVALALGIAFSVSVFAQAQGNPQRTPLIGTALSCGATGPTGGLGAGTDLQRYDIDTNQYPYAMCNDGSKAIFYFRPFQGEANRNRWVIFLQGGGSCSSPNDCAKRWCSVDTSFSSVGMSSNPAPKPGIRGQGILERRADNPTGGWNQVLVKYCSSDKWSGTAKDVIMDADDPITGQQVFYRTHFLGSRIIDAAIQVLRRQKGEMLTYTLGPGANVQLPGLDDAQFVLLAGASGGGNGVQNNLDRLAAALRRTNNNCKGKTCSLEVRGLHDSAFNPTLQTLDFSMSAPCRFGICTPEAYFQFLRAEGDDAIWKAKADSSCAEWHQANDPDLDWQCSDEAYVIANHVTTPVFIRQGQFDRNHVPDYVKAELGVPPANTPITPAEYARLVREQAAALADAPKKGAEGASMTTAPGAFIPTCPDHETLTDTPQVYGVRIRAGTQELSMFDVLQNWLTGKQPSIVIAPNAAANTCPDR
ncbi:MAG: pectin acetylesterase-family hydrolase [Bryobacteraceae bacterium]